MASLASLAIVSFFLSNLTWTGLSVCLSSFVHSPFFDELCVVNVPGAKVLGF